MEPNCNACEARRSRAASIEAAGGPPANPNPLEWCCNLDGDLPILLTLEEEEKYFSCSVRTATSRTKDLVPCPQPDCPGLAVAGGTSRSQLKQFSHNKQMNGWDQCMNEWDGWNECSFLTTNK
jgi:hypothetical protein